MYIVIICSWETGNEKQRMFDSFVKAVKCFNNQDPWDLPLLMRGSKVILEG
ncbi:MAG: hypothetical protein WC627_11975 [Legionella sp.]|jgi:hypothetical protein